jgi:putative IMPACT (imprinted ancient) family translation regulator
LVRAYAQGAKLALDAAGISTIEQWRELRLSCSYAQHERLAKLANSLGALCEKTDFTDMVAMNYLILDEQADAFCAQMVDASAGTAQIEQRGTREAPAPQ